MGWLISPALHRKSYPLNYRWDENPSCNRFRYPFFGFCSTIRLALASARHRCGVLDPCFSEVTFVRNSDTESAVIFDLVFLFVLGDDKKDLFWRFSLGPMSSLF